MVQHESSLQIQIIRSISSHPILSQYVFHIPNGGYRNYREAKKLKSMGVKKGVSDLFLPYPNILYHGLWQEVKSHKGHISEEQKEWIFKMRKVGYAAEAVRNLEESVNIFLSYLDNTYIPVWKNCEID